MCNSRKAYIHCEDGEGFRVELFSQDSRVTVVWCRDEAHAVITAEKWERDGEVI